MQGILCGVCAEKEKHPDFPWLWLIASRAALRFLSTMYKFLNTHPGYLPKKIALTHRNALFWCRTKRRTEKLFVVLKDAGVEQLCRFAVERWRRPLPLTDWHDGRTEAQRPAKDPAGPEHTHTHTSRESKKSGTLLVCWAAWQFILPLHGG